MALTTDRELRRQLVALLTERQAHGLIEDATADFPAEKINERVPLVPYSFWQLLEHMRLSLADILSYMLDADYLEKAWPDDYWPKGEGDAERWRATVEGLIADRDAIVEIVKDPATDLFAELPWGEGQTLLREVLVAADHLAYHTGAFILMRKTLGIWK